MTGTQAPSLPPWDGKERLNVLLVGVDQRNGDTFFNTDTLIVVSVDPKTKEVAMFQVPRDTVGRAGPGQRPVGLGQPLPAARSTAGSPRTATAPTCGPARPRARAGSTP